jgi:hypothetical protein
LKLRVQYENHTPENLRVVSDRHIHFVLARREQQSVARGAELAVLLDGVSLIDLFLDRRGRHGRVEDEDVGAEVGLGGAGGRRRAGELRQKNQKQGETGERSGAFGFARMVLLRSSHGWLP